MFKYTRKSLIRKWLTEEKRICNTTTGLSTLLSQRPKFLDCLIPYPSHHPSFFQWPLGYVGFSIVSPFVSWLLEVFSSNMYSDPPVRSEGSLDWSHGFLSTHNRCISFPPLYPVVNFVSVIVDSFSPLSSWRSVDDNVFVSYSPESLLTDPLTWTLRSLLSYSSSEWLCDSPTTTRHPTHPTLPSKGNLLGRTSLMRVGPSDTVTPISSLLSKLCVHPPP